MTPQDILNTARYLLNDILIPYRHSDTELLEYVNDGVKEVASLAPQWFAAIGDLSCIPGAVEQTVSGDDAIAILDVLCIHGGDAVLPMDLKALGAFQPGWRNDAAGPARSWAPSGDHPLRFFIYPKAPPGQVLDIKYVKRPGAYTLTAPITDIPDSFQPALVDYVVFRASAKDDEAVNTNRAASFQTAFYGRFQGGK